MALMSCVKMRQAEVGADERAEFERARHDDDARRDFGVIRIPAAALDGERRVQSGQSFSVLPSYLTVPVDWFI